MWSETLFFRFLFLFFSFLLQFLNYCIYDNFFSNGLQVPEIQITIKLDNIVAQGDASTQKILQVGPSNQTKTDLIKR